MPDRARIPKGASLNLEMALSIMAPRAVTTTVVLEVHAGKAAKLTVKAEAVLPAIEVAEGVYEFGEVSIGATSKLPVTITNPSPVPAGESDTSSPDRGITAPWATIIEADEPDCAAVLTMDLVMHPQFRLELPRDSWNMDEYDESPLSVVAAGETGSAASSRRTSRSRFPAPLTASPNVQHLVWCPIKAFGH